MNNKKHILLIEDNPDDVLLLQRACRTMPIRETLQVVGNAPDAIKYLMGEGQYADRAKYPMPEVLVLDMSLPGMDALEFLEWLRSKSPVPNMNVIILSGYPGNDKFEQALRLGCKKFFVKPHSDPERLREICQEIQNCGDE